VNLRIKAARIMGLAQHGRAEQALQEGTRLLEAARGEPPTAQAALWYALSVAHHILGDNAAAFTACDRCLMLAAEADSAGWASNALSMRAMALVRTSRIEPALLDLARAEAELTRCDDDALGCWAHTGLGYTYLELRLYELAEPHMLRALELDARPIPLPAAPVIDLKNLAELHLRWADEIERVGPQDDDRGGEVGAHREQGHAYAVRALEAAHRLGDPAYVDACQAMELCARPRSTSTTSSTDLAELTEAFAETRGPDYSGGRAVVGGALARTLWGLGRRTEAIRVAREAAAHSTAASDWQVPASAQWLLVEMEAQAGVPGAAAGRAYAGLLSQVLWHQRLATLQGAHAAMQVERLFHDKQLALQAANEDALTGVGNRRLLDETLLALRTDAVPSTPQARPTATACSLLLVDLDDFKVINDTYGHGVGDEVLRAVAMALRGVARADDLVVRLGGDEFVVLAVGADDDAGVQLAQRVTEAVASLMVGTADGAIALSASVGVATTADITDPTADLLLRADASMYAVKNADGSVVA
jgi:diguanylate cyclase (GGDEF)-like protein